MCRELPERGNKPTRVWLNKTMLQQMPNSAASRLAAPARAAKHQRSWGGSEDASSWCACAPPCGKLCIPNIHSPQHTHLPSHSRRALSTIWLKLLVRTARRTSSSKIGVSLYLGSRKSAKAVRESVLSQGLLWHHRFRSRKGNGKPKE